MARKRISLAEQCDNASPRQREVDDQGVIWEFSDSGAPIRVGRVSQGPGQFLEDLSMGGGGKAEVDAFTGELLTPIQRGFSAESHPENWKPKTEAQKWFKALAEEC